MSLRDLDVSQYVGKQIDATAIYADHQKQTKSWLVFKLDEDYFELSVSGYADYNMKERFANGERNITVPITIINACIMESNNGGRTNQQKYSSIHEYYADPSVKDRVFNVSYRGLMARIGYSGNPDEVDLVVTIELPDGTYSQLSSTLYGVDEPREWYTEVHKDNPTFKFTDGFFENAGAAIAAFSDDASDDMFGTRYFPVLVFAESMSLETINDIAYWAKGHSRVLTLNGNHIVGTRCKPDEYQEIITQCYEHGGQVPKGVRWDWD